MRYGEPRRPYALDDEARQIILEHLSEGGSRPLAAKLANICLKTLTKGIEREEVFAKQVERAEALGEWKLARRAMAGKKGWQGAAWMLERKFGYHRPPMLIADVSEEKSVRVRRVVRAIMPAAADVLEAQEAENPTSLPMVLPDADARTG